MGKLRSEDVAFLVLIAVTVAVVIWLLSGSPSDTSAIVAVALFLAGSEFITYKAFFSLDKKTAISFVKIKSEISSTNKNIAEINKRLESIKTSSGKRNRWQT